jgi:AP-1-like factor
MLGSNSIFTALQDPPKSDGELKHGGNGGTCPKTKEEVEQRIVAHGASPFVPPCVRKTSDNVLGTVISCKGSNFPKTEKSDQNVEVLSAWRDIRANPKFKVRRLGCFCFYEELTVFIFYF